MIKRKNNYLILFMIYILSFTTLIGCSSKNISNEKITPATKVTELQTSTSLNTTTDIVKIPGGTSPTDKRYNDVTEVLKVALEKTVKEYGAYQLIISDKQMTGARFVEEVKTGKNVNVIWRTYTPELSKDLRTIYIDPRKGLMGYRIFLIDKKKQVQFSKITNIDELKKFSVGQGNDWLDVKVFKNNGINVVTGSSYEGLFKMLLENRFDYFSRGIGEAYTEYEDRKATMSQLHVEESILVYYPWPYFYYVNPKCPRIAERIKKGLEMMLKDGSMDKLFMKYNKAVIEKANIKNRRIIKLENPLLKGAPIDLKDEKMWYNPEK